MNIALDFDGTWTEDPAGWMGVVELLRARGHDVRIVTIRDERHDRTPPLIALEAVLPVIYTRGVAKAWFCTHFADGWLPDVWIDDSPKSVFENSPATPEWLATWRRERDDAAGSAP